MKKFLFLSSILVASASSIISEELFLTGPVTNITSEADFKDKVESENAGFVVTIFYSAGCEHCQRTSEAFAEATDLQGAKIFAIEVNKFGGLANKYHVSSLPTVIYFKNGGKIGVVIKKAGKQLVKQIAAYIKENKDK